MNTIDWLIRKVNELLDRHCGCQECEDALQNLDDVAQINNVSKASLEVDIEGSAIGVGHKVSNTAGASSSVGISQDGTDSVGSQEFVNQSGGLASVFVSKLLAVPNFFCLPIRPLLEKVVLAISVNGTKADQTGDIKLEKLDISSLNSAPASSNSTGNVGEVRITSDYIYVCVATNTWKRSTLSTW